MLPALAPRRLSGDARCSHHTVEVGGHSPGSPLTQSTFSRALRVLKCKPISRRGHPDPALRVPPFLLLCLWWHRAQPRLVGDEPEPLCSESTLSPCLSFPPMCPTEAHRQRHLGCSLSLVGCVVRCLPMVLFHPCVPQKTSSFFLILSWETRPSSLAVGRKRGAIYLPDFVRAWPASCRPLIDWKCAESGQRRHKNFRQNNSAAPP